MSETTTTMRRTSRIGEPRFAQFLFASPWASPIWLAARIYLGYLWLHAGWEKITGTSGGTWTWHWAYTNDSWLRSSTGLKGFATFALTNTKGPNAAVNYGWYASFLRWLEHSGGWLAPVTWKARSEDSGGKTSPEELLAAAHAACFSMALSNGLTKTGTPPDRLEVTATCTFQPGEGVTKMHLEVVGVVPEADDEGFGQAAQTAKENCPVSKALAGIPEITLDARLEHAAA